MKMKKNFAPQYRKGWLLSDDLKLAKVATNVIRKGGSKSEAYKVASRELGRTIDAAKTRWRALNGNAAHYRQNSITDNGVRVQGLTVKQTHVDRAAKLMGLGGYPMDPEAVLLGAYAQESPVTITVGGYPISGSPTDLRKILGI